MINLLRKNRKKLVSENSEKKSSHAFSKYLTYSIGEIILVVIGILIAIQIDDWNTKRQHHKEEVYILQSMYMDLTNDVENLETLIKWTKKRLASVDTIAKMLENPETADKQKFMSLQTNLMIDNYFVPSTGTYDEGMSSGKLSYIQDNLLREHIFDHYRLISNDRDNDNGQYKVTNELILPLFVEEVGATKSMAKTFLKSNNQLPELDLKKLAKSKKYFQMLLYTKGEEYQIGDWTNYIESATSLMQRIETSLKSF